MISGTASLPLKKFTARAGWITLGGVFSFEWAGRGERRGWMSAVGPQQLDRLFREHGAALALYARIWCRAPDDVVQEALIALARQTVAPNDEVAWLYRAVRNGAISAARAQRRRSRHERAAAAGFARWFAASPDDAIDAQTAAAALAELPEGEQEVIVARLWGLLTFEQIAELVGCSSSAAHRRYQAGLVKLRERLGVPCPIQRDINTG